MTSTNLQAIGALMVSKMVIDGHMIPRFLFREKRVEPEDSGWRIFTGLEPEGYMDEAENFAFYEPSTILAIDPSLEDILLKGVGSVYEKTEDGTAWYKVTDFEMDDDYMVTHKLTAEWTININNLFERTIEESGDLLYTTGDKSVRLTIWEDDRSREELFAYFDNFIKNRDESAGKTLQTFDFSDAHISRAGYLIREDDGTKEYNVIYGFTLIDHETLQVVLYFDDDDDLDWAIHTWKGITLQSQN